MQLSLSLAGLTAPPPLAWEQLASGQQVEAVAVLARLMVKVLNPQPEQEPNDDRQP
jgi:hypothetical protein